MDADHSSNKGFARKLASQVAGGDCEMQAEDNERSKKDQLAHLRMVEVDEIEGMDPMRLLLRSNEKIEVFFRVRGHAGSSIADHCLCGPCLHCRALCGIGEVGHREN